MLLCVSVVLRFVISIDRDDLGCVDIVYIFLLVVRSDLVILDYDRLEPWLAFDAAVDGESPSCNLAQGN